MLCAKIHFGLSVASTYMNFHKVAFIYHYEKLAFLTNKINSIYPWMLLQIGRVVLNNKKKSKLLKNQSLQTDGLNITPNYDIRKGALVRDSQIFVRCLWGWRFYGRCHGCRCHGAHQRRRVQVRGIKHSAVTVLWEHVTLGDADPCHRGDGEDHGSPNPDPERQDSTSNQSTQRPLGVDKGR